MAYDILNSPQFQNAEKAREYLEAQVWPTGPVCPNCGSISKAHYKLEGASTRPGLYKCKDCRLPFTVTVGTVFERSKIPLNVWLKATHLLCASKKGMSSKQLERMLGVTYKTAWFMTHRIREAMTSYQDKKLGSGPDGKGGIVEVDETFWGKREGETTPRGTSHKMAIMSLVERGGKARSYHVTSITSTNVKHLLQKHITKEARLMTDEALVYKRVGKEFKSHESVNHSRYEYVRGNAHTNTVEGFFSILKRGLIGTYHHVGEQHLQRYVREFDFRYNHREKLGFDDKARSDAALRGIRGKRLTYRRTDFQQNA